MADRNRRLAANVAGEYFVDATCIDCDTCRWMAPETFDEVDDQSRVHAQPVSPAARRRAAMALLSCPTGSIGNESRADLAAALASLPDRIEDEVFHCGFHSEKSFGAASYLIVRERGNVLVDSPRFTAPLLKRLDALGGVRWLFLSHADDVADHARFRERYGCERILHRADVDAGTRGVEVVLEGLEPLRLDADLLAIPTPGHTAGSSCLLHRDTFLFTGDHLARNPRTGGLYAFRSACWHDWGEQTASMERLLAHRFRHVLPGHGHPARFEPERMRRELEACVRWMRTR